MINLTPEKLIKRKFYHKEDPTRIFTINSHDEISDKFEISWDSYESSKSVEILYITFLTRIKEGEYFLLSEKEPINLSENAEINLNLTQRIEWLEKRFSNQMSESDKDYLKYQMKDLVNETLNQLQKIENENRENENRRLSW